MEKIIIAIALVVVGVSIAFMSCDATGTDKDIIKGNGNLVTSERVVSAFEKISVSGNPEVKFNISDEYKVVVKVDSNLVEYTNIYTSGNVLYIEGKKIQKETGYSFTKYSVDVYCPVLTGIIVEGDSKFSSNDTIISSTFDIIASGDAIISVKVNSNSLTANMKDFGKLTIVGNSEKSIIDINRGDAILDGKGFFTKDSTVSINGGTVYICVADKLKADLSGEGQLFYRGQPSMDLNIGLFSKIEKF